MKIEPTFTATIYVGAKEHYDGKIHTQKEAQQVLQKYCNNTSCCITLDITQYIYKDGYESGFVIGLINYPRFPANKVEITKKALEIAELFLKKFNQYRISVVCSDKTYMLENNIK